jgi:phage anti-repressor protein
MEIFNIVEAIEKNPNTKLSNTYNNKLIDKIKNNFNEEEQKLYIVLFYSFLNYDEYTDYVVDLDDVWKWLGFSQKANTKRVLEKNFIKNKDYKILLCKNEEQKKSHGGTNKETILLNINTFKLFCLLAGTEKAKEIHKYYVRLENILHKTLQEESEEFKNQVLQLEKDKQKLVIDKSLEKHNLLLKEYGTSTPLVYLVRIKSFENKTIGLKIGESRQGISERYGEHKSKYEECVFMDCFRVLRSKDFESFLHSHPDIKPHIIKNLKGHEGEKELFLVGGELSYNKIISIINSNIHNYNNFNTEIDKLRLENENLKLILELNKIPQNNNMTQSKQITELVEISKKLLEEINELKKSNQEIQLKLNNIQTKNAIINVDGEINKNFGNRIQKINSDNGNLIKYYESISEVIKEDSTIKRSSLAKAINNNTIYNGFRWIEVSRDLDPKIIHNYKPTKETKTQNSGYIAKLNKEQTEILNVYLDRKVASLSNGYESHSALDIPVKNKKETRGFYYMLYSDCDKKLINSFEKSNGKVFLYLNAIGQYDSTKKLVNTYCSKYECARANNMADRTLNKILDKDVEHNGFNYKNVGSKKQWKQ